MVKRIEREFERGNDGCFYCTKDTTGEYTPGERVDEEAVKKVWNEQFGLEDIDLSWIEKVVRF